MGFDAGIGHVHGLLVTGAILFFMIRALNHLLVTGLPLFFFGSGSKPLFSDRAPTFFLGSGSIQANPLMPNQYLEM